MNTVAQYIVAGLGLTLNPKLNQYIESGLDTVCAITGERIICGIPWRRVIPSSTAEYLDLMNGMAFPYLSLAAAAAFKGSWNMGSRLIFEDGSMYHPYISAESAEKSERTYWSKLVRDVWPSRANQNCLCIITDNFQKKIWPRAKIGQLGVNTQILLFDSGRSRLQNLTVDWERLIETLSFVEEVYDAGFSKQAISESLFLSYAVLVEHSDRVLDWETELANIRDTPEFVVSILIAQKKRRRKENAE